MNSPRTLEHDNVYNILDASRHPGHAVLNLHFEGKLHQIAVSDIRADLAKEIGGGWRVVGRKERIIVIGPEDLNDEQLFIGKKNGLKEGLTTAQAIDSWRLHIAAVAIIAVTALAAKECKNQDEHPKQKSYIPAEQEPSPY